MKRLLGNAFAIRLIACPLPQPTSATSIPAFSRSTSPDTSGSSHVDKRHVHDLRALFRHQLLELGERRVRHAATLAEALDDLVFDDSHRSAELHKVRQVIRACGARDRCRVLRRQPVSPVRRRRTRRSCPSPWPPAIRGRSARSALPHRRSCWLVEGGSWAIVSKSPVRWPMLVIKARMEPFRTPTIWPANASAFAWSIVCVVIPQLPPCAAILYRPIVNYLGFRLHRPEVRAVTPSRNSESLSTNCSGTIVMPSCAVPSRVTIRESGRTA